MTEQKTTDDDELDAFLHGKGELAGLLKEVPQPQAPAALDAAIMADAEKRLKPTLAANDACMPGAKTTGFFSHWYVPWGVAASTVFAAILSYQWFNQPIRGQAAAIAVELSRDKSTDTELAQAWLVKIDLLLKAQKQQQAQQEWLKFKQQHPQYPVPDELKKRLEQ